MRGTCCSGQKLSTKTFMRGREGLPGTFGTCETIEILELECGLGHVMRSHNVYSKW